MWIGVEGKKSDYNFFLLLLHCSLSIPFHSIHTDSSHHGDRQQQRRGVDGNKKTRSSLASTVSTIKSKRHIFLHALQYHTITHWLWPYNSYIRYIATYRAIMSFRFNLMCLYVRVWCDLIQQATNGDDDDDDYYYRTHFYENVYRLKAV